MRGPLQRGRRNLVELLAGKRRLFVCGLALDFCVADSAHNARDAGFDNVFMVLDAARAAHIPGVGGFGSGFLQAQHRTAQHSTAQRSTAQRSTAQHSTA